MDSPANTPEVVPKVAPRGLGSPDYERFTTQDASDTPKISPYTLSTTPTRLVVPPGAVVLVAKGDGIFWFGENAFLDGSADGKGYKIADADKDTFIPVTDQSVLYVKAASGSIELDFMFVY